MDLEIMIVYMSPDTLISHNFSLEGPIPTIQMMIPWMHAKLILYSFAYNSSIKQLPQWVRPYVQVYDKFGLVQRDLRVFFKEADKDVRKNGCVNILPLLVCDKPDVDLLTSYRCFHTVWWLYT